MKTRQKLLPDLKYSRKQLQDERGIAFLTDGPSCVLFPLISAYRYSEKNCEEEIKNRINE